MTKRKARIWGVVFFILSASLFITSAYSTDFPRRILDPMGVIASIVASQFMLVYLINPRENKK